MSEIPGETPPEEATTSEPWARYAPALVRSILEQRKFAGRERAQKHQREKKEKRMAKELEKPTARS